VNGITSVEENMKRVICFDLWGTLVTSSVPETYEDYLSQYWPQELIQKTVRDLLMTNAWTRSPLREHDGQGILRPDHLRTAAMLLTRLHRIQPPTNRCFLDSNDWDVFDRTTTEFTEMLVETARLWKRENKFVSWMHGAENLVRALPAADQELVLVTNTTDCGIAEVERVLRFRNIFWHKWASCDYPFAKPDRRVWEYIMGQFPDMNEYWMIGNDPIMDIAVPVAMGWKTILVNHPDGVPISKVPKIIGETK
jgi:FMN phosphatase YigB (HAD superfamily)